MQAAAGFVADGRAILNRARYEAQRYKEFTGQVVPGKVLASRTAMYMQAYTLYSAVRPFGSSVIIGSYDRSGPQLYLIEPSGVHYVRLMLALPARVPLTPHGRATMAARSARASRLPRQRSKSSSLTS